MQSPTEYRRYAEECERIARDGAHQHRAILLDIAKAWRACAEEAERQAVASKPAGDGKLDGR
jgi:hypothetical protein